MGVTTLAASDDVLRRLKAAWDAAADELDGCWRRLSKASTDGFSPKVVAAVEAFREPWVGEIKTRATEAQDHGDAIALFRTPLWATDGEVAAMLGSTPGGPGHAAPAAQGEPQ